MSETKPLTPKERTVIKSLIDGLFLRQRRFSPSYEIAASPSVEFIHSTSRLFVRRDVVDRMLREGLLAVVNSAEHRISILAATEKAREAFSLCREKGIDIE